MAPNDFHQTLTPSAPNPKSGSLRASPDDPDFWFGAEVLCGDDRIDP